MKTEKQLFSSPNFSSTQIFALSSFLGISILLASIFWWKRSTRETVSSRYSMHSHVSCGHWIQIRGDVRFAGSLCLRGSDSLKNQVNRAILLAKPRCLISDRLPLLLPKHGEVLFLSSGKKKQATKNLCEMKIVPMSGSQRILARIPILLNQASVSMLVAIPNLRKRIAKRIVSFREKHGPFRDFEALRKVRGVGPKMLQTLRRYTQIGRRLRKNQGRKPSKK